MTLGVGVKLGVAACGVGRGAGVGTGLGVGVHLPVHGVVVGVGVGDAVGVCVDVGVDVAVCAGEPETEDAGQRIGQAGDSAYVQTGNRSRSQATRRTVVCNGGKRCLMVQ